MEWQHEMIKIYLIEVMRQRDFARHSLDRYISARDNFKADAFTYGDIVEMYAAAQALLTSAAQISKLLWVVMPKRKPSGSGLSDEQYAAKRSFTLARAKAVRKVLNVSDDSILKNRQVRNAVEHFDERIDSHILDGAVQLVDSNVCSVHELGGIDPINMLRHIDPYTNRVSVLDDGTSLTELWSAIQSIGSAAATHHDNLRTTNARTSTLKTT
ncbi:hypothetical protein [Arthrobacter cavernae]|uniref:Uncharacterized protein n=1 Tax=Arthrobacter cavernae TaxID=2817681 RepID=A0A939KM06_9MICC|nr:hypothetical protein [Arthrobacter cavernae]MBO1267808.1 hypothetical protein [Arthrobacter cavernae]